LQGDVVFVPPVGAIVNVDGEVHRPAIYEIKNESTITDVVRLAGGLTPEADTSNAMLTRIDESQHRVVVQVDLATAGATPQTVHNGDLLRVFRLRPTLDSGVLVQGHVFTSGAFAYRQGMRLSDVLHSIDDLRPNADIHYVLIRRELPPDRHISVTSADLAVALFAPHSKADPELMPRDRITVFDLASGRDHVIQPVLDELRLQSNSQQPTQVVRVDGRVRVPGEYPLEQGMTVADLIRAGGGLTDAAYGGQAELTRYKVVDGETRRTDLINIDLAAAMRYGSEANVTLEPFDNLSVKEVSQWNNQESVVLQGEVRFPGRYAIKRGETLRSVIVRAGGLTDAAFPEGSVFTREELKKREQEQLEMLATRMQTDLTALALSGAAANQSGAASAFQVGQSLLGQLRSTKAVGRLVIDLPQSMRATPGSTNDIILRDGDQLLVPKFQQQVTVIGEVQSATSHLYSPTLSEEDYISLSGGMTRRADHSKIYVVRANGSVVASEGNRWFQRSQVYIKPGDTVVVPLNMEKMPALPFWTAVTTIIYNVAIAAAAVHSF
jgi:polysaccharide export outer membrane protein